MQDSGKTDHLFSLRQIIEKYIVFNIDVHLLFIDFKKAYDKIKLVAIWEALIELGRLSSEAFTYA